MADKREKRLRGQVDTQKQAETTAAGEARQRLSSFDPREFLNESAMGAFKLFEPRLRESLESLRGSQVSTGRLRTGFASTDEDRLFRDFTSRFTAQIADRSLGAAGLELGAIQTGDRSRDRLLELLTAQQDRATADRNARFGFDDFVAGVGGLAGTAIPFL